MKTSRDCPNCKVPMPKGYQVYRCPNCLFERPIREYKAHADVMTPSQEKAIEFCKSEVWRRAIILPQYADQYEWKKTEVQLLPYGLVSLVLEAGKKGDEGTVGALLCRRYLHVFIGRKGALVRYTSKGDLHGNDVFRSE